MGEPVSRRAFLDAALRWGSGLAVSNCGLELFNGLGDPRAEGTLKELLQKAPVARYWTSTAKTGVSCEECHGEEGRKGRQGFKHDQVVLKCLLCAHGCAIPEGGRGRCRARMNVRGELRSLVYGRPMTEHVDPIEKKPFYHFLPGSEAYSFATSGCPLRCRFCQNWEISQALPEDYRTEWCPPRTMVERATRRGAPVIAFTYNEPTVFMEYLTDTARAAKKAGLRCVLISCGLMNEAPLKEMIEVLDGIKFDLKGISADFYRSVCQAELEPVLRSIKQVARAGRHLEIVNLVVPTLNDSETLLRELPKWMAGEVGVDVPLHFTRFHPDYQLLNLPPTPVSTLERACDLARKAGLRYVYLGNVPGHPGNHTYCPGCGKVCIERKGFFTIAQRHRNGACASCGFKLAGVWS